MDIEKDERDMPDGPRKTIKRCKDCYHNGRCEIQDAPPSGQFTQEEIEMSRACVYFTARVK